MRAAGRWAVGCTVGLVLVAGCGSSAKSSSTVPSPNATEVTPPGDIPDNQVFVTYSAPGAGYSFRYPEGWARQRTADTTTFTHNYNQIAVSTTPSATPPTKASVEAVDVAQLRSQPGFKLVKVDTVALPSGMAIHVVYQTTSAADTVTGKRVALDAERYVFWHRGKLVTMTLATPHGSDNVDAWHTVTSSLAWR